MASARHCVPNPAWATEVLVDLYESLSANSSVPPAWLPRLGHMRRSGAAGIIAHVHEYGCGTYGCVYPTLDPNIVLKITADDTEAEFAAELSPLLERPVCVQYHLAIKADGAKDPKGSDVYLLWRESAEHVGDILDVIDQRHGIDLGTHASILLNTQHQLAQDAYTAIYNHWDKALIQRMVAEWLESCEAMARQTLVPELRDLGDGLVDVYGSGRIFFGDIHPGNLGLVRRAGDEHWVITDPGHVAVIDI